MRHNVACKQYMLHAKITAVGGYVPDNVVTNNDLATMVDTSDEWITTRTGIKERRILKGEPCSFIVKNAVSELLKKRNIDPREIDLLIVTTITGDYIFPATSQIVCAELGMTNAWGYDLSAACSGFMYGLSTGSQFIQTGKYKKVVVAGADKMSAIINYEDRTTCVIFGDGGGAVLLEPTEENEGIMDFILHSDGNGCKHLHQPAGGSKLPPSYETVAAKQHFVYQEGQAVFKNAVVNMAEVSAEIMQRNGLAANDIQWLVPHQANLRIIDATQERMGIEKSKVMINIHRYGNTTNGTLPLCLWDYENQLKKGDNLILSAFGGGFTWGSVWVKWAY